MAEWWSGSDVIFYIDKKEFDTYYGHEHAYLLMNHSYEVDWLLGWVACDRLGVLGVCNELFSYMKTMKKEFYMICKITEL